MNYVILSLKHSEGDKPCFWKPNDAGYTMYPFNAGVYSAKTVEEDPEYYNNGRSTLAIPLTDAGMSSIGLSLKIDVKKTLSLAKKAEKEAKL